MKKLKIKRKGTSKPELPTGGYSFVIGNGSSRKDLQLKPLMDYGIFFACNWFFKEEWVPHVLVASDEPMTKTILKMYPNFPRANWFYTWFPKPGSGAKKATTPEKFAAGPMSVHIAAEKYQSKKIFMIGMDFFGFGSNNKDQNGQLNNLYAGKKHYRKDEEGPAPTYRNWQRRFQWILQNLPDVELWHVNPFEGRSPERLIGAPNWHQCSFENLMDHLENDAELIDIKTIGDEDVKLFEEENPDNVRASYERQMAGQENVVMKDPLSPQDLLNLRMDVQQHFMKPENRASAQDGGVLKIDGHDIHIQPLLVREGNILRLANQKEFEFSMKQEMMQRYGAKIEGSMPSGSNGREIKPDENFDFNDLPPPPPPPPV